MVRDAILGAARCAKEEVGWPAKHQVHHKLDSAVEFLAEDVAHGDHLLTADQLDALAAVNDVRHVRLALGDVVGARVAHACECCHEKYGTIRKVCRM